jgi:hypothetical protein
MGRDEQIEEREVLDSIFPDEITGMWSILQVPIPYSVLVDLIWNPLISLNVSLCDAEKSHR